MRRECHLDSFQQARLALAKLRNRRPVAESGSRDLRVTGQVAHAASAIWPRLRHEASGPIRAHDVAIHAEYLPSSTELLVHGK